MCQDFDCPVDCVVESWSRWSTCTKSCGGGYRERSRDVIPGSPGGEECPCDLLEREYCNEDSCVGKFSVTGEINMVHIEGAYL